MHWERRVRLVLMVSMHPPALPVHNHMCAHTPLKPPMPWSLVLLVVAVAVVVLARCAVVVHTCACRPSPSTPRPSM